MCDGCRIDGKQDGAELIAEVISYGHAPRASAAMVLRSVMQARAAMAMQGVTELEYLDGMAQAAVFFRGLYDH